MATYHQYSEIVAAYGYRLPPPPPPQASRVGLALLYAAIGVALGTFTGTALAVATLPPDASTLTGHLAFAKSIQSGLHIIHPIANAGQAPVIQVHANHLASAAPAPAVIAPAVQNPAPVAAMNASVDHSVNASAAPTLLIHQAPAVPNHANSLTASDSSAPAAQNHASNLSAAEPTFLIHQAPAFHLHAFTPSTGSFPAPVVLSHSVIQASNAGQPQILNLAPIVHAAPAVHAQPLKSAPAASPEITIIEPSRVPAQPVLKQLSSDSAMASVTPVAAPPAAPMAASVATPVQPPAAPSTAAIPSASLSSGLDSGFKPLTFYSEGDATVISYDAAGDTITTDDGRTFTIGATVSASNAVSWQDYRSNVHYRCDQNGNCSLVRTGVIALNAKLM
jgi:hypothetical protein